ncbi:MAG: hemerythrin domain-containing protein [Rhodospirillales bacterium]|nr:hemerythrin domain-containing protein [Rhodospirillales bacterium]
MDVFEILKKDHERARALFAQIEQDSSHNRKNREDLFNKLKKELIAHAHVEEKVFYPALRDKKPTHDEIVEGINEHHQVETLLSRMEAIPIDSDEWMDAVRDLKRKVEHHVHEEEDEIFPKARKVLSDSQFEPLADMVQDARKQEE